MSQNFGNILVSANCDMYITWPKQFKLWKVPAMAVSIMLVSVLTCCALPHYMSDLKAAHMNWQCSLIWEFMLYEFKLGYNTMETTKNICCAKGEATVQ